jgi:hypothetical protein
VLRERTIKNISVPNRFGPLDRVGARRRLGSWCRLANSGYASQSRRLGDGVNPMPFTSALTDTESRSLKGKACLDRVRPGRRHQQVGGRKAEGGKRSCCPATCSGSEVAGQRPCFLHDSWPFVSTMPVNSQARWITKNRLPCPIGVPSKAKRAQPFPTEPSCSWWGQTGSNR